MRKKKKFFNQNLTKNLEETNNVVNNQVNSINKEDITSESNNLYSDHIYVSESKNKEQLYDRNNPIVKTILVILGLFAFFGSLYYILTGFGII